MRSARSEATIQDYVAKFSMTDFLNDDLLNHLQRFHFPAYSHIYIEQAEQEFFYFLVEGQVQCSHYHANGKLAVVAVSKPFSAIGDVEILSKEPVNTNVIATQDTVVLGIASAVVHQYGANDPRFLRFIIDQLRAKLYETNTLHTNHVLPVAARLAAYMLTQPAADSEDTIVLPNKEELAPLLGTTQRHLNRVIRELVEVGYIQTNYPQVKILNRQALQDYNLY